MREEDDREFIDESVNDNRDAESSTNSPVEEATSEGVSSLEHEVRALQDELEKAQAKVDEYLDGWQRARAELANYRKRVERDQAQIYQVTAGNVIKKFLDVVDDLDRALKNRPQESEGAAWAEGIELIYRKLISILESEGVTIMDARGQQFDPNLHEAISQEESDEFESGQVIEQVKNGYQLGDRILRPALVRVAK